MAEDRVPTTKEGVNAPVANPAIGDSSEKDIASIPAVDRTAAAKDALKKKAEVVSFPRDLGKIHHPDYIMFMFLDIVSADGKWFNDGLRKYNNSTTATASKRGSRQGGIQHQLTNVPGIIRAVGEPLAENSFGLLDKSTVANVAQSAANALGLNEKYKHTGDVVKLMMPSSVQFNDGAGWQAVNASPTGMGLLAQVTIGDASGSELLAKKGMDFVSNILMDQGQQAFESVSKKVFNPFVSQAFESMQRRQFRFEWTLTPKNNMELENVKKIIDMFRFHLHPSLQEGNMFLKYPSQVDVQFMADEYENVWLPKITTCVIKDFSTNYTPNNQWSTVEALRASGAPYQYQISVTVEEITPLVKQDLADGY